MKKTKIETEYIKKPYVTLKYVLNKNTIKNFIRPEWHRDFRIPHLHTIIAGLHSGNHFSEVITVNSINSKYRLINGNHRIRAVRHLLEKYPSFKIECSLNVYRKLSIDQEKEIYGIINRVKSETSADYLKAHCHNSEIFKLILADFPIKTGFYPMTRATKNYIQLINIVKPYLQRDKKTQIVNSIHRHKLVEMINTMTDKDYETMKDFLRFFKRVFGNPGFNNVYSRYFNLMPISRIYYTEAIGGIGEVALSKKFKDVILTYPNLFQTKITSGREMEFHYIDMIRALNSCNKHSRQRVTQFVDNFN